MGTSEEEIGQLLADWSGGDLEAFAKLIPLVVTELQEMARQQLARESNPHALQPAALVNEAYLRLAGRRRVRWRNRSHFFGSLAQMLRRILVDRARKRRTSKRGGGAALVPIEEVFNLAEVQDSSRIALDDALWSLESVKPRQCRVVELRFLVGLTVEETAKLLSISPRTVKREWRDARTWLCQQVSTAQPQ